MSTTTSRGCPSRTSPARSPLPFQSPSARSRLSSNRARLPRGTRRRAAYMGAKRLSDIVFSVLALVVIAPLMAVIAILVWLDSGFPIIFRQIRLGKHGKPFTIYKFRTMKSGTNPYAMSPTDDKTDARVTRIGYFLRRTSLDELPQLFCVLKGDMSLVGPRPEMDFIASNYTPVQSRRLAVLPGVTGLWQISHARKFPIHQNIRYDLYYVRRRTLSLDAAILIRTVLLVVRSLLGVFLPGRSAKRQGGPPEQALPAAPTRSPVLPVPQLPSTLPHSAAASIPDSDA